MDRFRSRSLREHGYLVSALAWLALLLNFNALAFTEPDEYVQFGFVQHLFGDTSHASGYFFGLGLLEVPFYAFADLLGAIGLGGLGPHGVHELVIAAGFGLLTLAIWPLLRPVFDGLELRGGLALLLAAVGTPFFFYATIQPAKNHSVETVLFTLVVALLYRYFTHADPERWLPLALGTVIGVAATVRYPNAAQAGGLAVCLFAFGRRRAALEVAGAATATGLLLLAIPLSLGEGLWITANHNGTLVGNGRGSTGLHLLDPVYMVFGVHRGLFVWSPVAALGALGLVLLVRTRPLQRRFLVTAIVTGAAILVPYVLTPWGTTGWSFSNRFLTPLLPLVAIGLAGLLAALPRPALAAALAAVAWSLYLMLNALALGGPLMSIRTPTDLVLLLSRTHSSWHLWAWALQQHSNVLFWRR